MAKNIGPLICLLILIMDIVAGILGIEAEVAQNKVKHLKVWIIECRDPSHQAFKLGLAAAVLLALAHAIGNLLAGCVCVRSKRELDDAPPNQQLAVASLIFSWIIVVVAFSMLMAGTIANSRSRKSCGIAHNRVLSIGGVLCFIHGLFMVAYYVSATATAHDQLINKKNQSGDQGGQANA
ncbi:protein DESIGUAL 2 [Diospyros lotus]|uniref:protein DESIGUAL 2 n=1 Tax=Diospyros lotus TaxID=55363 RepID=UPI00225AF100|nr:protein DESIGUAL 2 [Diospyros lotus]